MSELILDTLIPRLSHNSLMALYKLNILNTQILVITEKHTGVFKKCLHCTSKCAIVRHVEHESVQSFVWQHNYCTLTCTLSRVKLQFVTFFWTGGENRLNTDFGKQVKKKLIDIDQRQKWLIEKVQERTGLFLDVSYFQKIMRGERHPQKIVDAICEILEIEDCK